MPWEWRWSSAGAHIGKDKELISLDSLFSLIPMSIQEWKRYIVTQEQEVDIDTVRRHTYTGRPLGATEFIRKLEIRFNRRLIALPRGRPKKEQE